MLVREGLDHTGEKVIVILFIEALPKHFSGKRDLFSPNIPCSMLGHI